MEELDRFKNIKDKVSFEPVHSTREKELWEALEQRIQGHESAQKRKNKIRHLLYYATAACVLMSLSLVYYLNTSTQSQEVALKPAQPSHTPTLAEAETSTSPKPKDPITQKTGAPVLPKGQEQPAEQPKFRIGPTTKAIKANTTQYLALADGSTLALDAQSTLHHQADFGTQREVSLEGRAYFEVAHDRSRPFKVYFGNTHLVVLGTKFYVRSLEPNSYAVAVMEGSVKVYDAHSKQYTVLTKNQQLEWMDGKHLPVHGPDAQISAWKKDALKFDDVHLSEVFFGLSKAHGKEISYAPGLAECRFSGNLSDLNLVEALNFIKLTAQIEIEDKHDRVHIAGKACH